MSEQQPSYVKELLSNRLNGYAFLGTLATSVLLSIPYGLNGFVIPLIGFATAEALAVTYLPSSIRFRAWVDAKHRKQQREQTKKYLINEIAQRVDSSQVIDQIEKTYTRMTERVNALYAYVEKGENRQNVDLRADVERMDDACLEYLYMTLGVQVIKGRTQATHYGDIKKRLDSIDRAMAENHNPSDLKQLEKARAEYTQLIERHRSMESRKAVLEAALLTRPDQIEEIYQNIMTAPLSKSGLGQSLKTSIDRLKLQADIEAELSHDMIGEFPNIEQAIQPPWQKKLQPMQRAKDSVRAAE